MIVHLGSVSIEFVLWNGDLRSLIWGNRTRPIIHRFCAEVESNNTPLDIAEVFGVTKWLNHIVGILSVHHHDGRERLFVTTSVYRKLNGNGVFLVRVYTLLQFSDYWG